MNIYIHTYIHAYIHACMHTYIHTYLIIYIHETPMNKTKRPRPSRVSTLASIFGFGASKRRRIFGGKKLEVLGWKEDLSGDL
jgi:hypothetical protein